MWDMWVDGWCQWRRAAGHRDSTIRLGAHWVRRCARTLNVPPELVTFDDLLRFLAQGDWKPETLKSARSQLRGFFWWAQRAGRRADNPAADLPSVSVPRPAARPVGELTAARIFGHPDLRVRMAAVLAGRMGLRRAEVAAACRADIVDGRLLVRGKGGHARWVPLHPQALPLLPPAGPLVPSLHGGGHLSADRVGRLLSDALGAGGTAHRLRHRFATVAYRSTHDLSSVQTVLGHRNLTTTQRYIALRQRQSDRCGARRMTPRSLTRSNGNY